MTNKYTCDINFNDLIEKFNIISEKGYIKGISNNYKNSCGLTFENEIGKSVDSSYSPDYKDIEIKCKQKNSNFNITLFSLSFNGPSLYESYYILKKYGKKDDSLLNKNKLYIKLKFNEKVYYNSYYFELKVDNEKKLFYINIYDKDLKLIEKRGYILFINLRKRVLTKLKKLCLIKSQKKKKEEGLYFKYYQISCYKFKGFDNFLNMIKNNIIKCTLSLRYSKNEKTYGQNKSRGIIFSLAEKDLSKVFDNIYFNQKT